MLTSTIQNELYTFYSTGGESFMLKSVKAHMQLTLWVAIEETVINL